MDPTFDEILTQIDPRYLQFDELKTLQINLGNLCNMSCSHCHLDAGPHGKNVMDLTVVNKVLAFLRRKKGLILDITGGCPEINPHFRFLLEEARPNISRLMVRTNLTILSESAQDWIPDWYRTMGVVIIASLPCYTKENVEKQRGNGAFAKSVKVLQRLNRLGYGEDLELNLVYNPGSDALPGTQFELEKAYKRELFENFGIKFTNLFTITNAPLGRFLEFLKVNGKLWSYMGLLRENFNPKSAANIMCRTLISVDYRGILYNCDFNQALNLALKDCSGNAMTIEDLENISSGNMILTDEHCFCCTAGEGSSCTGALVE